MNQQLASFGVEIGSSTADQTADTVRRVAVSLHGEINQKFAESREGLNNSPPRELLRPS